MYILPGIGSMLFQIIIGLVLAIPIFLKMYWVKKIEPDNKKQKCRSSKIGFILPIMVGCFVVLSMFSSNAHRLGWDQLPASLAIGAITGLFTWVVFYLIPLTRPASAVVSGVITLMLLTWMVYPYLIIPEMIIVSTMIVFYDIKPSHNKAVASITYGIVAVAILITLGQTAYTKITYASDEEIPSTVVKMETTPDIYFIVPDRFTSPSAMVESGLNPNHFVAELEARGFYVRTDAMSEDNISPSGNAPIPTTRTLRFLASVLNMGIEIDMDIPYNRASNQVKYHMVGKILKENGYTYHHIGHWWRETLFNPSADHNYIYKGYSMIDYFSSNELAMAVIDRSVLRDANASSLIPFELLSRVNRERHMYQLATFQEIAKNGEYPKFVFAHIALPHPPYIWMKDGSVRTQTMGAMKAYLEQLQFTQGYLLRMIDAVEEADSIIIIQSDEGIALFSPEENEALSENQWKGVLTAWRIPGEDIANMQEVSITKVLEFAINTR